MTGCSSLSILTTFGITEKYSVANASTTSVKSETEKSSIIAAGPNIAVVETEAGKVQGYSRNEIYTYHGIPYAAAKERFVPAEKVEHWDGVKLAFDYGQISPQQQRAGGSDSSWENPSRQFAMGVSFTSKEASKRVTELTLRNLGITADQIEKLQTIPYEQLPQASDKALQQTADELHIPAALGTGYGLSWETVVDGDYMPTSPVTKEGFAEAGKDIPLLIGSNLTEWGFFANNEYGESTIR